MNLSTSGSERVTGPSISLWRNDQGATNWEESATGTLLITHVRAFARGVTCSHLFIRTDRQEAAECWRQLTWHTRSRAAG